MRALQSHGDAFSPGTDLMVSLLAIMTAVFAFSAGRSQVVKKELTLREASLVKVSSLMDRVLERENDGLGTHLDIEDAIRQLEIAVYEFEKKREEEKARQKRLENERNRAYKIASDMKEALQQSELIAAKREEDLRESETAALAQEKKASEEGELRKELVGLKGPMKRVVFIVDRSASMSEGKRWKQARDLITSWINHLPVEEAALIIFNDSTKVVPRFGGFVKLEDRSKSLLSKTMERIKPSGRTGTLAALRKAREYRRADTYVLFSDGKPTDSKAAAIIEEARKNHPSVVINTVGLGVYFDKQETVEFLMELARVTGGSYRAR